MWSVILALAVGLFVGFLVACGGATFALRKHGYSSFDDLPDCMNANAQSKSLQDEMSGFQTYTGKLFGKYGLVPFKAQLNIEFSDGKKKNYDLYQLAADCVTDPAKSPDEGGILYAVAGEIVRRASTK